MDKLEYFIASVVLREQSYLKKLNIQNISYFFII
jgi:hypothetical protein